MSFKNILRFALAFVAFFAFSFSSTTAQETNPERPPLACTHDVTIGGEATNSAVSTDGEYYFALRGRAFEVYRTNDLNTRVSYTILSDTSNFDQQDMVYVDNHVYIAYYGDLIIFDVSDAENPLQVTNYPEENFSPGFDFRQIASIDGLFLLGQDLRTCSIFDVSNPLDPQAVTTIEECKRVVYHNGLLYTALSRQEEGLALVVFTLEGDEVSRAPLEGDYDFLMASDNYVISLYEGPYSEDRKWLFDIYNNSDGQVAFAETVEVEQLNAIFDYFNITFFDGTYIYAANYIGMLNLISLDGSVTFVAKEINAISSHQNQLFIETPFGLEILENGTMNSEYSRFTGPYRQEYLVLDEFIVAVSNGEIQTARFTGEYIGSISTGNGKLRYFNDDYILLLQGTGMSVIDVRDPANMQVVGILELNLVDLDMSRDGVHAYASMYNKVVYIDLSDPTNPFVVDEAHRNLRGNADLHVGEFTQSERAFVSQAHDISEYYYADDNLYWAESLPYPYIEEILGVYDNYIYTYHWFPGKIVRSWLSNTTTPETLFTFDTSSDYYTNWSSFDQDNLFMSAYERLDVFDTSDEGLSLKAQCDIHYPRATLGSDGRIYTITESAYESGISIFSLGPWPTPTATWTATPSSTPTATWTYVPTETPLPSATPHPRQTVILPVLNKHN